MRLALIQMSNSGSIESNMKKSINTIEEAASQGADLVLFPEVQLTEFFPQYPGQDVRKYQIPLDSDKTISWLYPIFILWKMTGHTMQVF